MHPSLANKIEQKRFETCVKIWFSAEFDADSLFCRFGYDCNFYLELIPCMATHIQNWLNHWCPLFFSGMILVYPQYILVYPNHKVESNNGYCCEPLNQPTNRTGDQSRGSYFVHRCTGSKSAMTDWSCDRRQWRRATAPWVLPSWGTYGRRSRFLLG